MKKLIMLASLSILLAACGGGATVKPDTEVATGNNTNTFEGFVNGYAAPTDSGDSKVYKFTSYSKVMESYHVGVRQARFIGWCSDSHHKFSQNGSLALREQLRKLYPGETIRDGIMCGDGKGGFYGFAHFVTKGKIAFLKAGALNPQVAIDFWPEDGNPEQFWPDKKVK